MSTYREIQKVTVGGKYQPTGKTKHWRDGQEVPPAHELKIVQYDSEVGFFLLHLDAFGNELTDTFHETIDEALLQAEWEYGVKPAEWVAI